MLRDFNKHKNSNRSIKFMGNQPKDNFVIEEDEDDYYMEEEDYDESDHHHVESEMMTMVPVFMDQALGVTELIIANRVRNSEKISDQDIYRIHRDSFKHILVFLMKKIRKM